MTLVCLQHWLKCISQSAYQQNCALTAKNLGNPERLQRIFGDAFGASGADLFNMGRTGIRKLYLPY